MHQVKHARGRRGIAAGATALVAWMVSATTPVVAADAATDRVTPRILAQEGLAIALASTVLQSQLNILFLTLEGKTGKCRRLTGGGSIQMTSLDKVSSSETKSTVTVFFDRACSVPYITADADVSDTGDGYSVSETATYLGPKGAALGSLSLTESATAAHGKTDLIGLGKFTPQNGAEVVNLGLSCVIPQKSSAHCQGGIAQTFPKLHLSLASVTPLTLRLASDGGVTFAGSQSDMRTGAPGSLSISTPTEKSLAIEGGGDAYGSAETAGAASTFSLFPPTPTYWTIKDSEHDARFDLQVVSDKKRNSHATVRTLSTGDVLATLDVDQSGTGLAVYADGSKAPITSWLLAD